MFRVHRLKLSCLWVQHTDNHQGSRRAYVVAQAGHDLDLASALSTSGSSLCTALKDEVWRLAMPGAQNHFLGKLMSID